MSSSAAPTTITAADGTSEGRRQVHSDGGGTTMAMQKKRARRVSFAEMTSVHFFDRDEEYETPPMTDGKAAENNGSEEEEELINLGFDQLIDDLKDSSSSRDEEREEESEDGNDDNEDDDMALPRAFLTPDESLSPGSKFGSATSNDEDNFFGPIAHNFIRPGRPSDSAMSEENHEITMDSTAFTMHFRSLDRSESGTDLKTPTEVQLSFEEKTPTRTSLGSSMALTIIEQPTSQSGSPVANCSGNCDSSDMSLIGENSRRYDYESLPPCLDALLAKGRDRLDAVLVSGNTSVSKSPKSKKMEVGSGMTDLGGNGEQDANSVVGPNVPPEPFCQKIDAADNGHKFLSHAIDDDSLLRSTCSASDDYVDKVNRSPKQLSKVVGENNNPVNEASEVRNSETLCSKDATLGEFCGSPCKESPLVDLMSSSPIRQRLMLMGSPPSVKQNSVAVSSPEEPFSFLSNEKRGCWASSASLQKSISKLNRLQASASLGDRVSNIYIRSLEFPKTPPLDSILKKRNKGMGVECLDSGISWKEGEERNMYALDGRSEALTSNEDVIQCEQSMGPQKQGESLNWLCAGNLSTDQQLKPADSLTLSRFSWSGKKNNILKSNDLIQKISPMPRPDSPLADYLGQEKVTAIAHKLVFSPEKMLQSKSSTWTEHQSRPLKESRLHCGHMKSFTPVKDASPIGNMTDGHSSTTTAGNLYSLSTLTEEQSCLPVVESSKLLRQPDRTESMEAKLLDQMEVLKSTEDLRISRDASSQLFSAILDGNIQRETDIPTLEVDSQELNKSSISGAASSSIQNLEELAGEKSPVKWLSRSPSTEELHSLPQATYSIIGEAAQSPTFNESSGRPRSRSAKKRSIEDLTLGDMEPTDEIMFQSKSPKLQRGFGNSPGISGYPDDSGKEILTAHLELGQWKDIISKFGDDADEWVSLPKERLTMPAIEMVEDIVTRMQRAKIYDILQCQILTQKKSVSNFQEKRVLEARILLCQLVHEKAKFYLRHVKKEKLLEKCQMLDSGIQKAQMQKISRSLHQSITVSRSTQGEAISRESSSACANALVEVPCNKVATIKEALEVSERKVANLTRSLHSSLKLDGEANCSDTIATVNEYLMRRMCCRFLRQYMQMCVIQSVRSRNGHYDVILDYLGFLVQSLRVTVGPDLSIIISNNFNDLLVTKKFPNINAYAALRFVLKAEISKKLGGRTLAQEMQVTRSLLGNVLDVVAEVQTAQMKFRNLANITFSTPTVEKLELQLYFVNFNTGKKVKLTLDMACLNRGVYPSEVVPTQFAAHGLHMEDSDDPLFGEIRDAVKSLRAGYLRIIRLCDCISQVVQAWGG